MKSQMKVNTNILLIFSIIAVVCLFYILLQVNTNLVDAINIYQTEYKAIHYIIGLSYFFILIFHLWTIVYIFVHFRHFEELKTFKIILLIIGVVSLFSLGGEKVMIDEIAKQYRAGLSITELKILNGFHFFNAVYILGIFLFLLKTYKLISYQDVRSTPIDERMFIIAQFLGIISGIMGLLFVFHNIIFIDEKLLIDKYWVFIPFFVMFLTPYGLAVLYWLSLKRKQKIVNWYDEKQLQDVLKSSLTTLIISIPGIAVFLFIKIPVQLYFFLYYLFLVLFVFSSTTLYFFKLKDNC
ncbi:MAG: hypothetical protein JXB49_17075 [Bacteroidales bacterium]|nr:hypothetical protein [Bacteroidales bacterium]